MSAAEQHDPYDRGTERPPDPRRDRPITGLFAELARETSNLLRNEVALAKAEMSEKMGEASSGAAMLAGGGLVAFAGFIFLLLAATLALANVVDPWLAALIVGGAVVLIGVGVMMAGRSRLKARNLQPHRTMETLREDSRWARAQLGR